MRTTDIPSRTACYHLGSSSRVLLKDVDKTPNRHQALPVVTQNSCGVPTKLSRSAVEYAHTALAQLLSIAWGMAR